MGSVSRIGALRCPAREEAASASGKLLPDATTATLDVVEGNAVCDTISMVSYLVLPDILVIDVADALAINPAPAKAAEVKKTLDSTAVILLKQVTVFLLMVLPLSSLIGSCLKV